MQNLCKFEGLYIEKAKKLMQKSSSRQPKEGVIFQRNLFNNKNLQIYLLEEFVLEFLKL